MRQRLQIARNLVTRPRLIFMDEPTGGLDVSVQARLLDLLRGLVAELSLAAVIVTHDLAGAAARPPHHRDEGWRDRRKRARRPGAGRPARSLHAAARVIDPAVVRFLMANMLKLAGVSKTFIMHLQGASISRS
jgi:hypothetical protein